MQDGATGHSAVYKIDELQSWGINSIFWASFSLDLNLIEAVWNVMKDYIEQFYPDLPNGKQCTYNQLRTIVQEAWDAIRDEFLRDLTDSMQVQCQAVTDANVGHALY